MRLQVTVEKVSLAFHFLWQKQFNSMLAIYCMHFLQEAHLSWKHIGRRKTGSNEKSGLQYNMQQGEGGWDVMHSLKVCVARQGPDSIGD